MMYDSNPTIEGIIGAGKKIEENRQGEVLFKEFEENTDLACGIFLCDVVYIILFSGRNFKAVPDLFLSVVDCKPKDLVCRASPCQICPKQI